MSTPSFDIDILARTIYGEARGEYHHPRGGLSAYIAVGNVVMNRLKQKSWFGHSIRDVCLKPFQFSCWNHDDPNYKLLQNPPLNDALFHTCKKVAEGVIMHKWPDLTQGADHYYCDSMKMAPSWAVGHKPVVIIGRHRFFKLNGVS
jgi:spore germination cell wall hydrolase CwlJ-like protein